LTLQKKTHLLENALVRHLKSSGRNSSNGQGGQDGELHHDCRVQLQDKMNRKMIAQPVRSRNVLFKIKVIQISGGF
jgi:hypothetical protein